MQTTSESCLLMRRLIFCIGLLLAALAAPFSAAGAQTSGGARPQLATATFAGGCFWCMQPPFENLPGVLETTVGYTGGQKKNPTYEDVSAGGTGHAESVEVVYDPRKLSYENPIRYRFYRWNCGRDARLKDVSGDEAPAA